MAEYEKKVREVLRKHGCYFVRHGKGDHDIWYSPITDINVAVDGKIMQLAEEAVRDEVVRGN